jgi:putative flippase GtrA
MQKIEKTLFSPAIFTFIKFCIVGSINTTIGLVIIFTLYNIIKLDYRLSNIIGYVIALCSSYILNKRWTFKSQNTSSRDILPFMIVFLVSYLANFVTLIYTSEILRINKNISQIVAMVVYTVINYFGNKLITFANK